MNEPTCDSEVYLYLCVVDISIWTANDAYCELCVMPAMFIWVGYVIRAQTIKLEIYGRFAECYTRQRDLLPSAKVKHSAKRTRGQNLCILGLKWHLCWVFVLWHSAKKRTFVRSGLVFAECPVFDTRQRRQVCRVPEIWHSANQPGLPSVRELALDKGGRFAECQVRNTRQTRRDRLGAVTLLFSPSVGFSSRQSICRVPDRKHSTKRRLSAL